MIQKDDVIPSNLVVRDVAIFLRQVLEQHDWIRGTKPAEGEPEQVPLEAGREVVSPFAGAVSQIILSGGYHLASLRRLVPAVDPW
jgi:hypothetical protein